jgi:dihydrofolate reductase
VKQYLFSRTLDCSPDKAVTLVQSDALEHVRELKRADGEAIWLCGGSVLAGALYAAGLIDQLILKVNPIVLGTGIPLLGQAVSADRLELRDIKRFDSGHLIADYWVGA